MARRHRRHSRRGSASSLSIGSGIAKFLKELATPVAFIQQITEKDNEVLSDSRPLMQKLKDTANIITGRMTGFHLFNSQADYKPPFTLNPSAIANKWTGAGLGMIVYGQLAKRIKLLPKGGLIGSIGKKVLIGGAVGGLFDAPKSSGTTGYIAPRPVELQNNNGNRYQNNYSSPPIISSRSSYSSHQTTGRSAFD